MFRRWIKLHTFCIVVALLVAGPLFANDVPGNGASGNQTAVSGVKIVAFGDSTTALRSTIKQVYADRLPALLAEHDIKATVINSGVGGSHTGYRVDYPSDKSKRRHALDRFQDAVLDHQPDVVVMQFGWNDSWVDTGGEEAASRIPVAAYRKNLADMIERLGEQGADVILMTPNRPRSNMDAWRVARTLEYVEAVRSLAAETETPLVDIWQVYDDKDAEKPKSADALLLDAVHPGDDGQALVARLLVEPIVSSQKEAAK